MSQRQLALDACVLIHAAAVRRVGLDSEHRRRALASRQLIDSVTEYIIPAPAMAEALRTTRIEERKDIDTIIQRARILPLNAVAADFASRLLVGGCQPGDETCPACHEAPGPMPCRVCNRIRGKASRVVDAMIAGCLLAEKGNWTLYSFNLKDFARLLAGHTRIEISEPARVSRGLPLFEYTDALPQADEGLSTP